MVAPKPLKLAMVRGIGWLVGVAAAAWAVSVGPAWYAAGSPGPWISLLAGGVCLGPAIGTWAAAYWSIGQPQNRQLVTALGGSAVRLVVVLTAGGALLAAKEYLRENWVLFVVTGVVYYLATLTTETVLFVRYRQRRSEAPGRD